MNYYGLSSFEGAADLADLAETLLDHYRRKDHIKLQVIFEALLISLTGGAVSLLVSTLAVVGISSLPDKEGAMAFLANPTLSLPIALRYSCRVRSSSTSLTLFNGTVSGEKAEAQRWNPLIPPLVNRTSPFLQHASLWI